MGSVAIVEGRKFDELAEHLDYASPFELKSEVASLAARPNRPRDRVSFKHVLFMHDALQHE